MQASHQKMRFLYRNGFILETCHICMDSLIISLHGNVNNSKFIKKKNPLNFDRHPPLKRNDGPLGASQATPCTFLCFPGSNCAIRGIQIIFIIIMMEQVWPNNLKKSLLHKIVLMDCFG